MCISSFCDIVIPPPSSSYFQCLMFALFIQLKLLKSSTISIKQKSSPLVLDIQFSVFFTAHLISLKGIFWDCQTFSGTCKRFMTVPQLQVCQCLFQNSITNLTEDRTVKVYNLKLIHEFYGDTKSEDDEYTIEIGCQD